MKTIKFGILPRRLVLAAVAAGLLVGATDATAACTLSITNVFGTNSSTGTYELSAFGTSNAGFTPSTPITLTVTASSDCPYNLAAWTATSSDTTFVTANLGRYWMTSTTIDLTFNAFANAHPSERIATISVTAGTNTATYTVSELGSADPLANREVRALYQRILGREPDSGGFTFWLGVANANPNGLGMMVDSFLTTPPAYEAMNTDFMVLALYQSILGTPPGSLSPVSYADWNSGLSTFYTSESEWPTMTSYAWTQAGTALVGTLINSSAFTTELAAITIPTCTGIGTSPTALSVTALYQNSLGAPPSCAQLTSGITALVNAGYSGEYTQGVYDLLLNNIWSTPPTVGPVLPTSLSFAMQGTNTNSLVPQNVTINATGSWTASVTYNSTQTGWISVTQFGVGPGTTSISINPTGLSAGTYTGRVTFSTPNGQQAVSVALLITSGAPVIFANPASFNVGAQGNGCTDCIGFEIQASDGSQIPFTATTSTPWLALDGVNYVMVWANVDSASLANGVYYGTINISAPTAANPTLAIPVELTVTGSTRNFTNPAFQNTTNALFTDLMYFTILGRDPDASGFAFWLNILNGGGQGAYFLPYVGGNPAAIRTAIEGSGAPNEGFVGSAEFLNLFK